MLYHNTLIFAFDSTSFNAWLIKYGTISILDNRPWFSTNTFLRWIIQKMIKVKRVIYVTALMVCQVVEANYYVSCIIVCRSSNRNGSGPPIVDGHWQSRDRWIDYVCQYIAYRWCKCFTLKKKELVLFKAEMIPCDKRTCRIHKWPSTRVKRIQVLRVFLCTSYQM